MRLFLFFLAPLAVALFSSACGGDVNVGPGGGGSGGDTGNPGEPCVWDPAENPCPAGQYCDAMNCSMGHCAPIGDGGDASFSPACGCDGMTYWNASLAASRGMAVLQAGQCEQPNVATCGGFAGVVCPEGGICNFQITDESWCDGFDLGGTCWVLPDQCDPGGQPGVWSCGAAGCASLCEILPTGDLWFVEPACVE